MTKLILAFILLGAQAAQAQQWQQPPQPVPQPPVRIYIPQGQSIVQRPAGSDYDATTAYCDPRYSSDDDCVERRHDR